MRDFGSATLAVRHSATGIPPGVFAVGQVAEPLRRLVPIEGQHRVDGFLAGGVDGLGIAGDVRRSELEPALVQPIKIGTNRAVGPRFDALGEQGAIIPDQRSRLTVIHQLLKLHRGHLAALAENERGNVGHAGHAATPCMRMRC